MERMTHMCCRWTRQECQAKRRNLPLTLKAKESMNRPPRQGSRSLHPYARDSTLAMLHRFHARKFTDHKERPASSSHPMATGAANPRLPQLEPTRSPPRSKLPCCAGASLPDAQHQALGLIGQLVQNQSQLLSYIDVYFVLAIIAALMIPLAMMLRPIEREAR